MGYKGRALIENGDIRFDKARVAQHGAELVLIPTPHDVSTFVLGTYLTLVRITIRMVSFKAKPLLNSTW